ncbi:tyrosine-protein phosphatase [Parabacteroides provencensis]|uniref:tyrosine-protein phosphatase n=1 Tax=Parabacteroides provencensis TaxID=1944636 RepID=UPI000C15DC08|nr:tyrosine-protein phosphatase [Parabacteroides provencensis]
MIGKILFLFTSITTLIGCTSNTPDIHSLCLRDDIGNYIIKWETDPQIEGTLKIYVSDNPETFNTAIPAGYANIRDGVSTYITNDNITRKYFLLSFNDKYYQKVGARSVIMDSIQNLRDLGGYFNKHNKMTKWGKVFRSGQLSSLTELDTIRLNNLGIKTIIDLRTDQEIAAAPIRYSNANIVHIPVSAGKMAEIPQRIKEDKIKKGDAILYMQDQYLQFVTDNSAQFAKALALFENADNYPILFNCSLGKDRSGFLAFILLSALGIPEDIIEQDYLASNNYIDVGHLAYQARDLSTDAQESITVLLTANISLMDLTSQKIIKEYGSVNKYLSKGLGLTEKKREQIKDMLLY